MADRLLTLANHPWSAPLVRALGLPQPRPLRRRTGAFAAAELEGRAVELAVLPGGLPGAALESLLAGLGARRAEPQAGIDALLLDASGCTELAGLDALYALTQAALPRLAPGGRVLLLAPASAGDAEAGACARAPEGFLRSLAKELGRRGATANGLRLAQRSAAGLDAPVAFFCSDRSAYVSGQVLQVDTGEAVPRREGGLFEGRTAVVTGAAGGIGAATARRLAADGAFVLCLDVPASETPLRALAQELGGDALALDIVSPDAPQQLLQALAPRGGLDILVHNAGITRDRTLARMERAEWNAVLDVNLRAVLAIDRALDAAEAWRPGAREICLSSISGIAGNAGQANYAAAKAGLIGYVAARSREGAGRMTVNAVAPGFIETAMTARIPFMVREAGRRLNALAQGGQPADVAEAIAFLARADAQALNGQVLRVCGQSFLGA